MAQFSMEIMCLTGSVLRGNQHYLFQHSEVHLNVEWRDLSEAGWMASVRALNGELVPVARTPWLRAREIWLRALDLDVGGTSVDVPEEFRCGSG
ncbi:hypothetical protein QBK99_21555 [Corticibacterium sp. UT-5YL-CI-8]|nr:hypothetical protein [Tianweitania sp. UT-5YL-CI-8]